MDRQPVGEYTGLAAEQFLNQQDQPKEVRRIDDYALRRTLLWLAERVEMLTTHSPSMLPFTSAPCTTCGHDRRDHAVGGDADNPSPWPCTFPLLRGAPDILCTCGDYQPLEAE